MKIAQSRITSQGQISVPAEVRKRLALKPGSVLEWDEEGDHIIVRRVSLHTFEDVHKTLFGEKPQPKSLAELKQGIRKHIKRVHAGR